MKIVTNNFEKEEYRRMLWDRFSKSESDEFLVGNISLYKQIDYYDSEYLSSDTFFDQLMIKFKSVAPEFCIMTAIETDPIFLFNLSTDSLKEYRGIMNLPKLIGLDFPYPDIGLSTVYEQIFLLNPSQYWLAYNNRYEDITILAYKYPTG